MSSSTTDKPEVDRLAHLFNKALFDLHSETTASTAPARLVTIIAEEPPSRSLPLAFVEATIGFAETFADLLHVLIRCLKATLSYDRVKQLQINDAEQGSQTFISLLEQDFPAELKAAYRSGALKFDLKNHDGTLNINNPCFSAGFISAAAVLQRFTLAGQYHRVVALSSLKVGEAGDTSDIEQSQDAKEAYAIATLICFAVVGAQKYAEILAEDGVTYEVICEGVKALKENGVVQQTQAIALLDIVLGDLENKFIKGRTVQELYPLIYGDAGIL